MFDKKNVLVKQKIQRHSTTLVLDLLVYLFCLIGIYQVYLKAGLPIDLTISNSEVIIKSTLVDNYEGLIGEKIISIDGYKFNSREELEIYLDGKNIGNSVELIISENGTLSNVTIKLTHFYSNLYIIVVFLVCTLFFAVAIFILIKAEEKKQAKYYHAVSVTTAALMMTTWGNYIFYPFGVGIAVRILFHLTCSFAPALFIHFIFIFPSDREEKNKKTLYLLYIISSCLFFLLNYSFIKVILDQSSRSFDNYISATNLFRIYIVSLIVWGIYLFIKSYLNSDLLVEKKKIKWLLLGLLIGPGGYILLWVVPQAFMATALLPEEFIIVFMSAVPLTFGISIYRYRLLDIDVVFNHSTVYGIVIILIITIYTIIVSSLSILIDTLTTSALIYIFSAIAILIGFIFQPVRNIVQSFVDKRFFKMNYNFKAAHMLLTEEIKKSFTTEILAGLIREKIDEIIQPVNILIYFPPDVNFLATVEPSTNYNIIRSAISKFSSSKQILADKEYIESGIKVNAINDQGIDFKLIIPIVISAHKIAFIALGKKKSAMRYNEDDVDFLKDVAIQAAHAIERIDLQKELLLKQEESERLRDLNETKSLFVSNVSHELKTPLTSIKMFAQILQETEMPIDRKNEYLRIIEKEGDRLARLIDNILDYTKIEKGIMEYAFEKADINSILQETLNIMEYQLSRHNFKVRVSYWETDCFIYVDKDTVKEALINLLSNAIKYSRNNKSISIKTFIENNFACASIKDNGIGIPADYIKNIFEPFTRSRNFEKKKIDGTGIGLNIVKHIMDAHNGQIKIESEPGKGSCFTLLFPILK